MTKIPYVIRVKKFLTDRGIVNLSQKLLMDKNSEYIDGFIEGVLFAERKAKEEEK